MILLALFAVLAALAGLLAACWWGSNIVFHPPKLLPNDVWPEQFGLKYQEIGVQTADGLRLAGWIIPAAAETDATLLMFHGWGDNKGDLLRTTHFLSRKFNLVYVDNRAHGQSEGTITSIGCLETRDAAAAVEYLKRERPAWAKRLGVYGLSMGGSLALWAAANFELIRCAAVEAPFPSFKRVVKRWSYNAFRLPYFPFAWLTLHIIRLRLGEDPEPYSPLYHVGRIAPRPTFFVAGGADRLMPLDDVKELFDAAGEPKEFWVVPAATHGKGAEIAEEEYRRRMLQFFEKNLWHTRVAS